MNPMGGVLREGQLNHRLEHTKVVKSPTGARHCAVPVKVFEEQVNMIKPVLAVITSADTLALFHALPNIRERVHCDLCVCKWDSVWMAEPLATSCLVPQDAGSAGNVVVLIDVGKVDERESATTSRAFIIGDTHA